MGGCSTSAPGTTGKVDIPPGMSRIDDLTVIPGDIFAEFRKAGKVARNNGLHVEAVDGKGRKYLRHSDHLVSPAKAARTPTLYLPLRVDGKEILFKRQGNEYLVDNSELQSTAPGIAYRECMDLSDKTDRIVPWGSIVKGVQVSDDWMQLVGSQCDDKSCSTIGFSGKSCSFDLSEEASQEDSLQYFALRKNLSGHASEIMEKYVLQA